MKMLRCLNRSGVEVATMTIDGLNVTIQSKNPKIAQLSGKPLDLRVSVKGKGLIGDGTKTVKPGEVGYPAAAIDTLEWMGIDVVR